MSSSLVRTLVFSIGVLPLGASRLGSRCDDRWCRLEKIASRVAAQFPLVACRRPTPSRLEWYTSQAQAETKAIAVFSLLSVSEMTELNETTSRPEPRRGHF